MATRPKTLVASLVPVSIGVCLAVQQVGYENINILITCLCYVFAFLVQISTNFYNDYSDHIKGADKKRKLGPLRLAQEGLIRGKSLRNASFYLLTLAFLIGLFIMEFTDSNRMLLFVGITSVVCALAYTGGPLPFAYNGLGDLFVIIFFGLVAVLTTQYVLVISSSSWAPIWHIPLGIGFLINNLLVVNNYRDWESDKEVGKNTLVVLLGRKFGLILYLMGIVISTMLCPVIDSDLQRISFLAPIGLYLTYRLKKADSAKDFKVMLASTSAIILIYGIIVGWSILTKV
jgi:1,4-dihydroxy-2-naphthoate octaprenyltransferase